MSLNLDKSSWKRVSVREVIRHVTDRVDTETSGLERFLAGEHIPSDSLAIPSWGVIGKDPMGPMFYKRFKPGHVLYVSRRTYLRKVAVPEFEGITGEKTFVLETVDSSVLLQEFLPFILSAEQFHAYAVANSRGSVNPYLNWGELAAYEFALPPLDEQKRISELLWTIERHRRAVLNELASAKSVRLGWRQVAFEQCAAMELADLCNIRGSLVDASHDDFAGLPHVGIDRIDPDSGRLVGVKSATEDNVISGKNLFEPGDLIYSKIRPNQGKLAVAPYRGLCSADAYPLVPARGVPVELLREAMLAPEFHNRVVAASTRTAMPKINRTDLFAIPIRFPDAKSRDSIRSQISKLDSQHNAIETERESIETMFRAALATLFEGQ